MTHLTGCIQVLEGEERSKVSRINLIDLAGSERSSIAQTSGERLRVRTTLHDAHIVCVTMHACTHVSIVMYGHMIEEP